MLKAYDNNYAMTTDNGQMLIRKAQAFGSVNLLKMHQEISWPWNTEYYSKEEK